MPSDIISVLVVEDDDDLRESLREFLALSGHNVTVAASGRAFYRALDEFQFTVAVIDVGLPDQSGFVLAEYLRANTDTGIVMLTARDAEDDQLRGYESGADIYLTKPVNSRVLVSAIARLAERLRGKAGGGNSRLSAPPGSWFLSCSSWTLFSPDGYSIVLTSLEYRFLEQLAQSEKRQMGRENLLANLYQQDDDYSGRALDAMVRRLRIKITRIQVSSNPIKSIYGVGYCFSENILIK